MRNPLAPLGGTEMEVLRHVWDLGEATARDVHERIASSRPVAYTTIMTTIKNLADKGYLAFEARGTAYVYRAARPPEEVRGSLLSGIVEKVFGGSPLELVQTLVQTETMTAAERAEALRLIARMAEHDGTASDGPPTDTSHG